MAQLSQCRGVATNIYQENGYTVVRYHSTAVVKFNDREVILDSGGYYTKTTKARMNQAANQFGLPYQVYQKDFSWFVSISGNDIPFCDRMVLQRKIDQ